MLRFGVGTIASAVLLVGGSAIGALGSWGLSVGAFSLVVGAVVCAMALDEPAPLQVGPAGQPARHLRSAESATPGQTTGEDPGGALTAA